MAASTTFLDEHCLNVTLGVSAIFAVILLRLIGGKNRSLLDYFFGMGHFVILVAHLTQDLIVVLKLTKCLTCSDFKTASGVEGPLLRSVGNFLTHLSQADLRIASPEYRSMMIAVMTATMVVGSALSLVTYLGYLFRKDLAKAGQLASGCFHLAVCYAFFAPEYFNGFKNMKDLNFMYMVFAPWLTFASISFLDAFCRICSGSSCAKASYKPDQKKKKN